MDRNEANALLVAMRRLREEVGDVTLMRVEVLVLAALEPGLSQRELMDKLGVSKSGMSAAVLNLTDEDALRRPGPGLIAQEVDPNERRRKLVSITAKGRQTLDKVTGAMRRSRGSKT